MLKITKKHSYFIFTLNLAPLTWNVSESEKHKIEKEVNNEIKRMEKKWIEKDIFST
jgi:hypothetical protein